LRGWTVTAQGVCVLHKWLGSEEIIAEPYERAVFAPTTFMSGTRHSDTHVQYAWYGYWRGPFERATPFPLVTAAADDSLQAGAGPKRFTTVGPHSGSQLILPMLRHAVSAPTRTAPTRRILP